MKARFMRGDYFEFPVTHKHLIYGNHRPQIRSATDALKSRIKIVPFKASFVGRENISLPDELREEASFVLGWLLEGHSIWLKSGRKLPKCKLVEDESADYFASQSTIEAWLGENTEQKNNLELSPATWAKASDLYRDFSEWKKERGEGTQSMVRFSEEMKKRFTHKMSNGSRFGGVELLHPAFVNTDCRTDDRDDF